MGYTASEIFNSMGMGYLVIKHVCSNSRVKSRRLTNDCNGSGVESRVLV